MQREQEEQLTARRNQLEQVVTSQFEAAYFERWDTQSQAWKKAPRFNRNSRPCEQSTLSIVSFNVLFDQFYSKSNKEAVIHSNDRFAHTIQETAKLNPHIAGFNEVTSRFYEMIKEAEWVRNEYWVSGFPNNKPSGFGNLLICRIEPICLVELKIQTLPRKFKTGFFIVRGHDSSHKMINVSTGHLIAYEGNAPKRDIQFEDLSKQLQIFSGIVSATVVEGDMNFHAEKQTEFALKRGFQDAWLERYNLQQNPGYTFDSNFNSLINEVYWGFERRRMRLDRILLKGSVQVKEITIAYNQPVAGERKEVSKHFFLKGGLLFVGDYLGLNGHPDKKSYLYPSDHFGLNAHLEF